MQLAALELLELLELLSWLDAELRDEYPSKTGVDIQCLTLPAKSCQQLHKLTCDTFVERVAGRQGLEFTDELRATAQPQAAFHKAPSDFEPRPFQSIRLLCGEGMFRKSLRAAPRHRLRADSKVPQAPK